MPFSRVPACTVALLLLAHCPAAQGTQPESEAFVREVTLVPHVLPVLTGVPHSPLAHLRIDVGGSRGSVTLGSITVALRAPARALEQLHVFSTGEQARLSTSASSDCFARAERFGAARAAAERVAFKGALALAPGEHHLWIAATVASETDLDQKIVTEVSGVTFLDDGETTIVPQSTNAPQPQRLGVALRKLGDDGAHTYRIPGLVATRKGTLIAVYDVRHRNSSDLPGDVDVAMSRSTDGGRTWQPMKIIMDMSAHGIGGADDPEWRWDGIGDPAILVDEQTQTIWVAAVWSHGDRAWKNSQPGMSPELTGQLMLVRSDDDGRSWSKPRNITSQVKRPDWSYLLQGPGKGITMQDGTLVFPAQYQDTPENDRLPRSTIIYSRDHGETWQIGTGSFDDTTEAQVVELEPGTLMLNSRYNRANHRVVMTTHDMGKSWQQHPGDFAGLIEPRACMASLIDVESELGTPGQHTGLLLFSNPNSTEHRERITIKASADFGSTWPEDHQILLDEGRGAGYSCMAMIDAETVGILYEGSLSQLTFQRVKLADVLGSP